MGSASSAVQGMDNSIRCLEKVEADEWMIPLSLSFGYTTSMQDEHPPLLSVLLAICIACTSDNFIAYNTSRKYKYKPVTIELSLSTIASSASWAKLRMPPAKSRIICPMLKPTVDFLQSEICIRQAIQKKLLLNELLLLVKLSRQRVLLAVLICLSTI